MRPSTHPDLSHWVDHVRGLGDEATRAGRDAHLQGCEACRRTCEQFRQVVALAAADESLAPSAGALRLAELIPAQTPRDPVLTLPRLVARLLGGGPLEPALAGLRGPTGQEAGPDVREAAWQAGPYELHLRVERDVRSPMLSIVGQLEAGDALTPVSGLPILVTSGHHVVARTDSNDYGEFVLACEPAPRLRLQVAVESASHRLEVPLGRLLSPRAAR